MEGSDEPAYYNSRVGGKFYRPVESYEDPEFRKNLSKAMNNPIVKKKISEAQKKRTDRQDPEYRKKMREGQKKRTDHQDPEYRKKLSEGQKKKWEEPEYRKMMIEKQRGSKKRKKNAER